MCLCRYFRNGLKTKIIASLQIILKSKHSSVYFLFETLWWCDSQICACGIKCWYTYSLNFRFTTRYANTSDYSYYGKYMAKSRSWSIKPNVSKEDGVKMTVGFNCSIFQQVRTAWLVVWGSCLASFIGNEYCPHQWRVLLTRAYWVH